MRVATLLSSLIVVLAIAELANHVFSYYVPRISSRLSGWKVGLSSRFTARPQKHDEVLSTELRFSAVDTSLGLQDESSYYAGDEENILRLYEKWRNEYAKGDFNNIRYQNFRANYIKLTMANAAELTVSRDMGDPDPVPLSLNEYGDLSPDEFNNLHNGQDTPQQLSEPSYPESNNGYEYSPTVGSSVDHGAYDQDRIRQIYKEWCYANKKLYDESRLSIFTTNLQVVENYHKETGKNAELNEYADLSPAEYQAIAMSAGSATTSQSQKKNLHLESMSTQRQTPPSTLHQYFDETEVERISQAYQEWCGFNGKEYNESRLDIFARNLLAVESFCTETGQNAFLNEYADLSPEEYNAILSSDTQASGYSPNTGTSGYVMVNQNEPFAGNQGIRDVYQDWCAYYEKLPSENGLFHFTQNYAEVEKRFQETGEELPMDESADLPSEQFSQETEAFDSRSEEKSEEERRREVSERMEQARRNEEERKKAEELVQLERDRKRIEEKALRNKQEKERAKFEEATKRVEEAQLLEQKQAAAAAQAALEVRKVNAARGEPQESVGSNAIPRFSDLNTEKERLQNERIQLEESLASDQARLKEEKRLEEEARAALEETDRQIDEIMKENKQEVEERPDPIIIPRSSYMDAVAKTWFDRSAYLKDLQEGRAGVLPSNPNYDTRTPVAQVEKEKQLEIKKSESLIDSIWNFMKEYNMDDGAVSGKYSENLILQADQLISVSKNKILEIVAMFLRYSNFFRFKIQDTTKKTTGVMGEELRFLKKAVDAMRRRNTDDLAADRARNQAKEWEQIQKGLEKEAKLAKQRREHDERIAEEARRKARLLKSEQRQHKQRAEEARRQERSLREQNKQTVERMRSFDQASGNDSARQRNPFSFFKNPLQGGPNKENKFSFFGRNESDKDRNSTPLKSITQAVKRKKKDSWLDAVFGFLAGEEPKDEIPGQGTITLEPAKRISVFDMFVSPEKIAPAREPGRGSITIDDAQESSIFSFFAKFGISPEKEKFIDPVRRKRVMDYESKIRSRKEKLSRLKAGRSRILEEKDKKLSRKEARRLQRELDSLAAGSSTIVDRSFNVPQLAKWTRTPDGRITGWISQASGGRYKMGTKITTSPIEGNIAKPGMTVTTVSGSKYRLGMPAARKTLDASSDSINSRSDSRSSPMGSFFGGWFTEETIPSLVEWVQNEDDTITGFANNKEGFDDGTQITTSPVQKGARSGMVIQTRGGSKYKLMRQRRSNNGYDD